MKLDVSLIRSILLEVERFDDGSPQPREVEVTGYDRLVVSYHVHVLAEAGYLECYSLPPDDGQGPDLWLARRLTWSGHQYLGAVRDDTVWRRTLERTGKIAGGVTLELVKATAVAVAKQHLGLPG